ncbi:MAG: type II toxin-antitoxin system mRNA interferase toxin, RelE/StbE family [Gammaproteobacteria bacterium]|nr:MAG: type II toxin-antitoxin system mRNA interferase toxin, RelE/StbE family [Gammaproteobacteria bacterium]
MWLILEHRRVQRRVGSLPRIVQARYQKWKDIVETSGPAGLRRVKGYHDEALRGVWKGHRSSRLGAQHRLIYRIVANRIQVEVVDLRTHDYRVR